MKLWRTILRTIGLFPGKSLDRKHKTKSSLDKQKEFLLKLGSIHLYSCVIFWQEQMFVLNPLLNIWTRTAGSSGDGILGVEQCGLKK